MASNSRRRSGSSASSSNRRRVVIGADETVRVRYREQTPVVESQRRRSPSSRGKAVPAAPKSPGQRMAGVKRDERERRQRAIARRRVLLTAGAVALVVLVGWGLGSLWNAPIFTVDTIAVVGNRHLSVSQVRGLAAVPEGTTLLKLPKAAIEARLTRNAWIADASVHRDFPHAVRIEVTERTPVAIVDAGGTAVWLIDASGIWLSPHSAESTSALPVIRDVENLKPAAGARADSKELLNALAIVGALSHELGSKVRSVSAPTIDRTALVLAHGVQVFFGSADDAEKKDTVARAILARNKNVVSVNVRIVDKPTWRGLDSAQ